MNPADHMPPELARRLLAFERRLRRIETATALLAGLAGALLTLLLLAALDRFIDTPAGLRVILTAGGALAAALAVTWWLHHWLWRRRDGRALARLVQRHYPKLGDRLLGAVELSGDPDALAGASPALLRAALRQVTREAEAYDFQQATPTRAFRYYAAAFAAVLLLLAAGLTWAPDALRQSLQRWLRPAADIERYTFVQLADLPDEWIVPHGEPFELACRVEPGSRWNPVRGQARIDRQPVVRAHIRSGVARFAFPGQLETGQLVIRIGDARRSLTVRPVHRPELALLSARIEWPDYLRRDPETRPVERGHLRLLDTARVSFSGQANRRIGAADIAPDTDPPAPVTTLAVEDDRFETRAQLMTDWTAQYPDGAAFTWSDPAGLRGARAFRLRLETETDRPPAVRLDGITRAIAVLPHEVITVTARAEDDYGLAVTGLDWTLSTPEESPDGTVLTPRAKGAHRLREDGTGALTRMDEPHRVSPQLLDAEPGEWITLRAWAADHHPGRDPVYTEPVYIQVYTYAEHAELLLQAMQRLNHRLEDLLRQEESQLATHEALASLDDDALALDRSGQLLEQGERMEQRQAAETERLAADADALMEEALRNQEMDTDVIQSWLEAAERLREAARSAMQPAAAALANAAGQPEARREELQDAVRAEQDAVNQLRRAAQDTQQAMDLAQARNFVNRLREAARRERGVGVEIAAHMRHTIGLAPEHLDPDGQVTLAALRRQHAEVGDETRYIRDDLGAFFLRTRQPVYEEVRRAMSEPDVSDEFSAVHDALGANLLFTQTAAVEELAVKLEAWADLLAGEDDGGGGEGGGDGDEEGLEPEVLIGLMRARVWEEMLREQTRALAGEPASRARSGHIQRAAGRQHEIGDELLRLSAMTRRADVTEWIEQLAAVSDEVGALLRQRETGDPVIGGQTQIIEAIAAAIQTQRNAPGAAESEGEGEAGPGSGAGTRPGTGGTGGDGEGTGAHDGPGTGDPDARDVERGSGDPATWPGEYRDAIQRYYEALETAP